MIIIFLSVFHNLADLFSEEEIDVNVKQARFNKITNTFDMPVETDDRRAFIKRV
ncbi:hypothetical protein HQ533_01000 [Candidatus Woesearchaeota archaeon]|nr:hypothetical protein [Candidatus Woesearchaeota archaeon]